MRAGDPQIDVQGAALFDRPTQTLLPVEPAAGDTSAPAGPQALADGELLGPYRVLRLLGRGGMGEVYEARDLRSGTRVAIKASRRPLVGEAARARFLHEGRLAAAVSHPNVVYVLAAEECRGTPVIVTELVAGGTLRELVERQGRLAVMEAVDLMRQVAAGLEAAARQGVVHRDVKPSNCFIDTEGQVKIGDFGLAISNRDVASRGRGTGIEGTLVFASPEQLRGDPPDVRSDIYSAGATLYFLLTGRPPFVGADATRLIARVLRDPPPSLRSARPDVPRGLDRILRRCLAKDPADRPASHADLSRLLLPFGSASSTPATLGFRALAGVVDAAILRSLSAATMLVAMQWSRDGPASLAVLIPSQIVFIIAYYGVFEGLWAASPGKWIFGLRVVRRGSRPLGVRRACARTGLWALAMLPGGLAWLALGPRELWATTSSAGLSAYLATHGASLIGLCVLFAWARPRTGFAGLHDLATGTRVVSGLVFEPRAVRPLLLPAPVVSPAAPRLAHYVVLEEPAPPGVRVGYDEALGRRVWIRHVPAGAPSVPLARRQVSRPSRLHWLAGRRDDGAAWDVYEMAAGEPLGRASREPRSWPVVRGWLLDLADEIAAADADGTGVPLTVGSVWVTDARATLLDWVAEPDDGASPASSTVEPFLLEVATIGLGLGRNRGEGTARPEALPLHAQAFLTELAAERAGTAGDIADRLRALPARHATITRARRVVHLAACAAAGMLGVVAFVPLLVVLLPLLAQSPDAFMLDACLRRLRQLETPASPGAVRERAAIETYMVGRFRPILIDRSSGRPWFWLLIDARRPTVDAALRRHGNPSAAEITRARAQLADLEAAAEQARQLASRGRLGWLLMLGVVIGLTAVSALAGLVSTVVVRGGAAFRLLDLAVVGPDGRAVSRARGFARAAVAWVPVVASLGLFVPSTTAGAFAVGAGWLPSLVLLVLFAAGGLFALIDPRRGLQDRIAGTSLVPR